MTRVNNLIGKRFGNLTVLERAERPKNVKNTCAYWLCCCDCGKQKIIKGSSLVKGNTVSCGCMQKERAKINGRKNKTNPNFIDMTGKKYYYLTVIKRAENDKHHQAQWLCQCECGKEIVVVGHYLRIGDVKSCGCKSSIMRVESKGKIYGNGKFNALFVRYRQSAKKRKLAFKLTEDEFFSLINKNCFYCGSAPSKNEKYGAESYDFVHGGIDRVDNNRGYELDNCVPCCETCNRAKLSMEVKEFLSWIDKVHYHIHQQEPIYL